MAEKGEEEGEGEATERPHWDPKWRTAQYSWVQPDGKSRGPMQRR